MTPDAQALVGVQKYAMVGTKMMRRADVMSVVRKLIQRSHEASHEAGERNDPEFFRIRRKQVAVLYEALSMLADEPTFINPASVPALASFEKLERVDGVGEPR